MKALILAVALVVTSTTPVVAQDSFANDVYDVMSHHTDVTEDLIYELLTIEVPYGCRRDWVELVALNMFMGNLYSEVVSADSEDDFDSDMALNYIAAQDIILDWTQEVMAGVGSCDL